VLGQRLTMIGRMRIRRRLSWCACLAGAVAGLLGCGGSSPRAAPTTSAGVPSGTTTAGVRPGTTNSGTTTAGVRSGPTASGTTGAGVRVSVAAVGRCAAPVVEFADESRVRGSERTALEGLLTALVRNPPGMRCASANVTISGRRPAGTVKGIQADYRCLAAATYIQLLLPPPATVARPVGLAAPPVQDAAKLAIAAINANERHGSTFCVYP
jgi:hypothetical protein